MAGVPTVTSNAVSASPSFSQTGQVDWVSLSKLSMSCPLEIASRLAKAGIDQVTVFVATRVCSSFNFPPESQKELTASLSRLKGHSSYSKLVHFGFGIRHIINDLLSTEQGALCVALSAALAVPYAPFQAACIWREICILKDIPGTPIPSIHQWNTFVNVCAGSLRRSKFHNHFEIFSRFLEPPGSGFREPAPARDIAKALLTLGEISKGSSVICIFVGGIECAWLAAAAELLFKLNIEVQDQVGNCFHRSGRSSEQGSPSSSPVQVYFRRDSPGKITSPSTISQRVCFITRGADLLKERISPSALLVQNPTSWEKIFSDTFVDFARLANGPARTYFTDLLACVITHSREYFSSHSKFGSEDFLHWWLYLRPDECLYHPNGSGEKVLSLCHNHLTEIPLPDDLDSFACFEPTQLLKTMDESLYGLKKECQCSSCNIDARRASNNESICLTRLALTTIRFLLILSPVSAHSQIPPSTSALRQLYNRTTVLGDLSSSLLGYRGVALVFFLFSGRLHSLSLPENISAISTGGVCVFLNILKDLNISIQEAMEIVVVPGHISHEDQYYTFIKDTRTLGTSGEVPQPRDFLNVAKARFELIAEELEERDTLGVLYKPIPQWKSDIFIYPEGLQACLIRFVRTELYPKDTSTASTDMEAGKHRWSFTEHTETKQATGEPVPFSNSWSILTWSAWDISSDDKSQWLGIDLLSTDSIGLFLAAQNELLSYASGSSPNSRNRVHISRFADSAYFLVQVALSSWAKVGSNEGQASVTVRMNTLKKQGIIKYLTMDKIKVKVHEDVLFELNPIAKIKQPSQSSKQPWKFLRI